MRLMTSFFINYQKSGDETLIFWSHTGGGQKPRVSESSKGAKGPAKGPEKKEKDPIQVRVKRNNLSPN